VGPDPRGTLHEPFPASAMVISITTPARLRRGSAPHAQPPRCHQRQRGSVQLRRGARVPQENNLVKEGNAAEVNGTELGRRADVRGPVRAHAHMRV